MTASNTFTVVKKPTISILMSVYNTSKSYLNEAIESILSQSYLDFEFLIIDDGSDTATGDQLQMWANRDRRIHLHTLSSNVGLTKALNIGLKLACGDYLARQDADDISEPNRLSAQLRFLEMHPDIDAVGTNAILINAGGSKVGVLKIDTSLKGLSKRNLLVHGSMLFRRHVFDIVGSYDEQMRLSQDYEIYLRMIRIHGMKIGVLQEFYYCLRQHQNSLSSRSIFQQLYYSVLAKNLTKIHKSQLKRKFDLISNIVIDLFFTHRFFLGYGLRRLFTDPFLIHEKIFTNMKTKFKPISACRICGNRNLIDIIDLGEQYLTGVFPCTAEIAGLTKGPLQVVKCYGGSDDFCGLVQLRHSYDTEELYGDNYGYRSGLNASMVNHLQNKISVITSKVKLSPGDLVIDIGSNDGTSLAAYPDYVTRIGVDPVGMKFWKNYPPGVTLIPKLFSAGLITEKFPTKKAKLITSFSMMYDLEDPQSFVREVASLLDPENGLWTFEQSYLPLMLERIGFDTICHEHIEYYGLRQIEWLLNRAGMKIVDVEFNDVNGGSFSVVATHRNALYTEVPHIVDNALRREESLGLDRLDTYSNFTTRIESVCNDLKYFLAKAKNEGKRVCGIGASTKGNVLLQCCKLTINDIEVIGEVNPDKFGAVTPGTWIPIEDEKKVLASKPDYLLILPWHFRENFLSNPAYKGHKLVFPLPKLEVVLA